MQPAAEKLLQRYTLFSKYAKIRCFFLKKFGHFKKKQ